MKKVLFSLIAVLTLGITAANAQVAIKWNPVYLGVGGLNLGLEIGLAPKWTLGIEGAGVIFNPWKNAGSQLNAKGGIGTLEARYYTCEKFNGHHFGLYASSGYFGEMTSQAGWFNTMFVGNTSPTAAEKVVPVFAGLSYGYYLKLAHGWAFDFYVGGGLAWAQFEPAGGGAKENTGIKASLSRLGIALSYKF